MTPPPSRGSEEEKHESKFIATSEDTESLAAWPIPNDEDLEHGNASAVQMPSKVERSPSLIRTLSRRSATLSQRDPGPPPDGGVVAWTQVALCHLTIFSTW